VIAQRLAIAQVGRLAELVDLRAGIVDVVFLGNGVAAFAKRLASASPTTAPRACATVSGPVGLAETYSTLTFSPPPACESP